MLARNLGSQAKRGAHHSSDLGTEGKFSVLSERRVARSLGKGGSMTRTIFRSPSQGPRETGQAKLAYSPLEYNYVVLNEYQGLYGEVVSLFHVVYA